MTAMPESEWGETRIAELRRLAGAAAPLPYVAKNHPDFEDDQDWILWCRDAPEGADFIANIGGSTVAFDLMPSNAAFVEAACNSVLSLLDALESAREQAAGLSAAFEDVMDALSDALDGDDGYAERPAELVWKLRDQRDGAREAEGAKNAEPTLAGGTGRCCGRCGEDWSDHPCPVAAP